VEEEYFKYCLVFVKVIHRNPDKHLEMYLNTSLLLDRTRFQFIFFPMLFQV